MNAQNNDSFSTETTDQPPEASKMSLVTTKEHKGALDILAGFWHKKTPEKPSEKASITPVVAPLEPVSVVAGPADTSVKSVDSLLHTQEPHQSITEKISHIFHKKTPLQKVEQGVEVSKKVESLSSVDKKESEMAFVTDEKFARLLKHDSTYHSMIRSEDLKNIQLQLSMRYMLLMLAIFVVIAWVVNNRVIMFGFSDFPLLARSRDALFALLTGLFSLTVWFGAAVWFRHRVGVIILRIIGCLLFCTVLVSIYLPFWR